MAPHHQAKAPVVAVLNMKGGVGKTTISGNLFRELYRSLAANSKTLVVDFDAQFNLTQLILTEKAYDALQAKCQTIWHVLEPGESLGVFDTSDLDLEKVNPPFTYSILLKQTADKREFRLLPGDFRLAALNLRENPQTLDLPRKRFKNFIDQAREICALVVLDCNPSSSFLTRCAIESATHVLVPIRPDKYSVLGLKMLSDYITRLPGLHRRPELLLIMNGVGQSQSVVETEIRGHPDYGPRTLVARIRQTGVLTARPDYTGFGADRGVRNSDAVRSALRAASAELASKLNLKT